MLYEALSGVNPVRGPTPAATARRIGEQLPPLERHRRDLPRELTRALDRALEADPELRGTLPELRDALAHGLRHGLRRSPWGRRARAPAAPLTRPRQPARRAGPSNPPTPPCTRDGGAGAAALISALPEEQPDLAGWLTAARLAWIAATLAVCVWQVAAGRPGIALLVLCAALPLVLLVRRPGLHWLAAVLAPVLGLAGLAGAFPALAGQLARWRSRALLGALGYWWLRLAELPLDGSMASTAHAVVHLLSVALLLGSGPVGARRRGSSLDGARALGDARRARRDPLGGGARGRVGGHPMRLDSRPSPDSCDASIPAWRHPQCLAWGTARGRRTRAAWAGADDRCVRSLKVRSGGTAGSTLSAASR